MEGRYLYNSGDLTEEEVNKLYADKSSYRILSLSETCNNMLMWSHCAESHSGIAIGISVIETGPKVKKISYVDDLDISSIRGGSIGKSDVAEKLLLRKYKLWEYEREQRVLIKNKSFVRIEIHEIVFGIKISSENKENVNNLVQKHCPNINIVEMTGTQLDKGQKTMGAPW